MSGSGMLQDFSAKAGHYLWPLRSLWHATKFLLFIGALFYISLELLTPSLEFRTGDKSDYRSAAEPEWVTLVSASGIGYRTYHSHILTSDRRQVPIDVILPQNLPRGLPLTIVATNFIRPDQLLDWVLPRGNNAVVFYHSARLDRLLAPDFPFWSQIRGINSLDSLWSVITTNPVTKWYSTYKALHEAPGDIGEIVRWAQATLQVDGSRINLVGLGSGSLTAAAAAHRLQTMGTFPHTITLIYPPANLPAAIGETLFYVPSLIRGPLSYVLAFVYRRLELERHLSAVTGEDNKRLLVIPINAWELSTQTTLPAVQSAGVVDVEHINANYALYYDARNITQIRDKVTSWLLEKRAIDHF